MNCFSSVKCPDGRRLSLPTDVFHDTITMEQSRPVSHKMGCFAKICEANRESNYDLNLESLYSSILFFFFASGRSLIELLSLCRVQKGKWSGLQFETDGTNRLYMVYFFLIFLFFCCYLCRIPTAESFLLGARSHLACGGESTYSISSKRVVLIVALADKLNFSNEKPSALFFAPLLVRRCL